MLVFIDESGDPGLKLGQGSSKFFTMALIVFEDASDADACLQRIDLLRRELGMDANFEFHFYENSDRIRQAFFKVLLPYGFFYYGVIIDKEKLFKEGFDSNESFYKYACGLLFENAKEKLENAIVTIDESGRKSFKYQLAKYLKERMNSGSRICIKQVRMRNSKGNNLLQLADMVAGASTRSLNDNKNNRIDFRGMIKAREIYVHRWPQ